MDLQSISEGYSLAVSTIWIGVGHIILTVLLWMMGHDQQRKVHSNAHLRGNLIALIASLLQSVNRIYIILYTITASTIWNQRKRSTKTTGCPLFVWPIPIAESATMLLGDGGSLFSTPGVSWPWSGNWRCWSPNPVGKIGTSWNNGRHLRSFGRFMSFRACEQCEHIPCTIYSAACWSKDWAESAMKEEHRTGIARSTFWISCIYCKAVRVGIHSLLLSWSAPCIAATAVQSHTRCFCFCSFKWK